MRATAIITFLALAGSAALVPAQAAQRGIYAGVSYAQVDKAAKRADFDTEAAAIYDLIGFIPADGSTSFDTKSSTYGFVVGYRLLEHLAIEGGYLDLGEVSYRDTRNGTLRIPRGDGTFDEIPDTAHQNLDSSTGGILLSTLGILPLSYTFELYARGGLLLSSNSEKLFYSDSARSIKASASKSGVDFLAGAGISMSVLEIYSVRLEYMRVFKAGEKDTLAEADADVLTLGIAVSF